MRIAPRQRERGQSMTEYVLLVLFVMTGLLLVLAEFEDVLVRLYANAISLIYSNFP